MTSPRATAFLQGAARQAAVLFAEGDFEGDTHVEIVRAETGVVEAVVVREGLVDQIELSSAETQPMALGNLLADASLLEPEPGETVDVLRHLVGALQHAERALEHVGSGIVIAGARLHVGQALKLARRQAPHLFEPVAASDAAGRGG